jgi:hypothetical protein
VKLTVTGRVDAVWQFCHRHFESSLDGVHNLLVAIRSHKSDRQTFGAEPTGTTGNGTVRGE